MEGQETDIDPSGRSRLWYASSGELRAVWKLGAFTSTAIAAVVVIGVALMLIEYEFPGLSLLTPFWTGSVAMTLATLVATIFCMRTIDRVPVLDIGLHPRPFPLRQFGIGLALSAAMIGLYITVMLASGWAELRLAAVTFDHAASTLAEGALLFLYVGFSEELLMRGYPFRTMVHASNPATSLLVTSVFFAAIHWNNPGLDVQALGNIFLAGIWLGRALLVSGSLWLPIGLHTGWNFTMGTVLGLPVSGILGPGVLRGTTSGPAWFTGGAFGPEGGLLATVILVVGTGVFSLPRVRRWIVPALLALGLAAAAPSAQAQWIEDPAIDASIQEGIRATYNIEFEAADRAFSAVERARPDHPAGPFFKAMVEWWRILIDFDDESRDEGFYRKLERVIDMCDKRLDANENDLAGLFFKGGSIGFRGRLLAMRKSWIKAAADGREALPIVQDAARIAPKNADINLGVGIYNYYADVLPDKYPLLKPVMLFLPSGDRDKGIRQLRYAAQKARYAQWEAVYFLAQVYSSYENKPSSALPFARLLADEFPANPIFQRTLGRIHVKLGDWQRASAVFGKVLDRCAKHQAGYGMAAEREAAYYLGYDAMLRRDYAAALKFFARCDEVARALEKDEPSGFRILAALRAGMTLDLLRRRADAQREYNRVLAWPEHAGSHDLARQYKVTPYSM